MTIDTKELRRLAQAVSGWSNCNQAWLDQSEDVPAAAVGHIDEDGNTYPIATIDCDQYYAAHQSLPLAKFYAAANPATINELLDRLEAAESEALEQARLNGMGSEREAALMAKLEAAEKDAAHQKALAASALRVAEGWERKCGELRAKIEQMERQRPFAWIVRGGYPVPLENLEWQLLCGAERPTLSWTNQEMRPLYALPGAQPKDEALWPTIANGMITPDGWKLVPIEPTPTMITAALESSHAINAHRAEYCYRAMIAVAPEAKP